MTDSKLRPLDGQSVLLTISLVGSNYFCYFPSYHKLICVSIQENIYIKLMEVTSITLKLLNYNDVCRHLLCKTLFMTSIALNSVKRLKIGLAVGTYM